MQEAKYYKKLNNQELSCFLCHHKCKIDPNMSGRCKVRQNIQGKLFTLNYGRPVALNIDPIEKKPLYHFYPGTNTYSLGTLGCNFSCKNCQNFDLSQASAVNNKAGKYSFVSPARIVEEAIANDCSSISFTYSEPTIFAEYALEIMALSHDNGLKNIWVSNGYMSDELLHDILPLLDAINIDLKSFDQSFYNINCGANLKPVLGNLKTLKMEQIHLEISTLLIPKLSDDPFMLKEMAEYIASELDDDTPWHLLKFSSDISWKLKDLPTTSDDILYEAFEIAKDAGLKYVYVGNVPGDQRENTYCPRCQEICIRRLAFQIERLDNDGHCPTCDRSLDIIDS